MHVPLRSSEDLPRLRRLVGDERDAEQRDRYRAALLATDDRNETEQIMDMLGRSRGFVQRWAYAYRDGGIEALTPKPRPGAAPKLPRDCERRLVERLQAGPTEADDGACTLRGRDVVRILEQEFAVRYSLGGAYDLLHRLGFSCLRPRPQHRKNDPQAMQAWLDRAPLLSTKSDKGIRTSRSRSGSRTRRGSDSREP